MTRGPAVTLILLLAAISMGTNPSSAGPPSTSPPGTIAPDPHKAAEELIALTSGDQTVSEVRDQMRAMMSAQMGAANVPDDARALTLHYQQQMVDLLFSELSSERLKPEYVEAYATTFTPDELAGLVAFFKTAPGRAYVDKMPIVTRKVMELSSARVQSLSPQLLRMQDQLLNELKAAAAAADGD
ncbi:MAG TPA: DUF2059 domain-containing protein [Patescibacteria group bacterium]|nr:DUF2059 domain-containing protein [Patescibacteria group bacterium]